MVSDPLRALGTILIPDSESDAPAGHEDKRQHQNDKPKKGGRKSGAGDEERPGKEMSKAARRKEQNRAAQKAFRERREARVTDVCVSIAQIGLTLTPSLRQKWPNWKTSHSARPSKMRTCDLFSSDSRKKMSD